MPEPIGAQSTSPEIAAAARRVAVLGIGSFEQHSAHLPVDTDFYFASVLSRRVALELDAVWLSPLPYSTSLEHRGFAGTVTLRPETLRRTVWEIAASVAEWGIRTLVLLNIHGGNFILNPAAREWNMDGRSPRILLVDFFSGLGDVSPNLHACEVETSMMLHLSPERVRRELIRDFVPQWGRQDLTHLGVKRITPSGVWGTPSKAEAGKGERWLAQSVAYCVARVRELVSYFEREDAGRPEMPGEPRAGQT